MGYECYMNEVQKCSRISLSDVQVTEEINEKGMETKTTPYLQSFDEL